MTARKATPLIKRAPLLISLVLAAIGLFPAGPCRADMDLIAKRIERLPPPQSIQEARERLVALAEDSGRVDSWVDARWESEFAAANPGLSLAHKFYANLEADTGRAREAIVPARRARLLWVPTRIAPSAKETQSIMPTPRAYGDANNTMATTQMRAVSQVRRPGGDWRPAITPKAGATAVLW